jgi:Ni,Fe-hydrogenase I large subunit
VHLYHLAGLDWVDVISAAKADPKATAELSHKLTPWPNSSPGYFKSIKDRLTRIIESGQLGIFTNGYWGHPAYKLPPEANLLVVAHYLEALDFQKDMALDILRQWGVVPSLRAQPRHLSAAVLDTLVQGGV